MAMKASFDKSVKILSAILIPISIAVAGHLFGLQMKNMEIASQEMQFQQEHSFELSKQEADWRITKSELVYKFMDALTSSEPAKRKLAVETILIALPEDGPKLVSVIAQNDPSEDVQASASNSLKHQMQKIMNEMFSNDKNVRLKATESAILGWQSNQDFIAGIIDKAIQEIENANGVWNAIVFLENVGAKELKQQEAVLLKLLENLKLQENRNKTILRMEKNLLSKL
jgi:hypothetical protein